MTQGEDLSGFWTAIATVIPVIALATIVEARALSARWRNLEAGQWIKYVNATLWAGVLIGGVFAENWALAALAGQTEDEWKPAAARLVVASSMTIMVLSPTMDLVVSNWAGPLSSVLSFRPIDRAARLRFRRARKRGLKRLASNRDHCRKQLAKLLQLQRDLRGKRDNAQQMLADVDVALEANGMEATTRIQLTQRQESLKRFIESVDGGLSETAQIVAEVEQSIVDTFEIEIEVKTAMTQIIELERQMDSELKKDIAEFLRDQDAALDKLKSIRAEATAKAEQDGDK